MKRCIGLLLITMLLSGCHLLSEYGNEQPDPPFTGQLTEIDGADVYYQPYVAASLQDWQSQGKTYQIVKKPAFYSKVGNAVIFDESRNGEKTLTGETINSHDFTAVHDTLPLPGYVRITNLNNGRQLIVRVNDRGPLPNNKLIGLSEAAAFRLNMTEESKIKVDAIVVAPDGSTSGKGMYGSKIAERSFALPDRPEL